MGDATEMFLRGGMVFPPDHTSDPPEGTNRKFPDSHIVGQKRRHHHEQPLRCRFPAAEILVAGDPHERLHQGVTVNNGGAFFPRPKYLDRLHRVRPLFLRVAVTTAGSLSSRSTSAPSILNFLPTTLRALSTPDRPRTQAFPELLSSRDACHQGTRRRTRPESSQIVPLGEKHLLGGRWKPHGILRLSPPFGESGDHWTGD